MGRKLKLSNFRCKKCGTLLWQNGKELEGKYFFMCLSKNKGCCNGIWIDIKNRIDQQGRKYE